MDGWPGHRLTRRLSGPGRTGGLSATQRRMVYDPKSASLKREPYDRAARPTLVWMTTNAKP
jgi:hypothetical protein